MTGPEDNPNPAGIEVLPPAREFGDSLGGQPFVWPQPPRRKFQHRYRIHILLFLATLLTTTFREAFGFAFEALFAWQPQHMLDGFFIKAILVDGLWYSIPVLTILAAHEFGHYFMCRAYNVDATLPFFIPFPMPPTGTFGAVIRIREPFPSKKALFDIGIGGPIGGFIALLPFLWFGLKWSYVGPLPQGAGIPIYGDPLLLKLLAHWRFGPYPPGHDLFIHPMAFAAWWGMLATALNLLPFGQLDGGHISYAVLGRRSALISVATLATTLFLAFHAYSWIMTTVLMTAMAVFFGLRHPRIFDEDTPLDPGRKALALFALVMFILCFTAVPVQVLGN